MIIDGEDIHLIDGGFVGGIPRIERALARLGKDFCDVRSIVLTHGHLDHTLNITNLQKLANCPVYAPLEDRAHVIGNHRYEGWSKICGWLERAGRTVLRFRPPIVDQWFRPGDHVSGLEVIDLQGHTSGHCGFLLVEEKLLLAGDLFANHFGRPSPPPAIFNDDPMGTLTSIRRASRMNLLGIFLNHGQKADPTKNYHDLQLLLANMKG